MYADRGEARPACVFLIGCEEGASENPRGVCKKSLVSFSCSYRGGGVGRGRVEDKVVDVLVQRGKGVEGVGVEVLGAGGLGVGVHGEARGRHGVVLAAPTLGTQTTWARGHKIEERGRGVSSAKGDGLL